MGIFPSSTRISQLIALQSNVICAASLRMSVLGKGDEEGLRNVEKDVLIPKKMKAKAMKLCEEFVKGVYTT